VSGVGDDVNPCSRTAPCKTFAGAISKTATNGEINCLDPAGYGGVTITKGMTIDCHYTYGSILAANANGIIVNGAGVNVTLRGLTINGASTTTGTGIRVLQAGSVTIDNVVIQNFGGSTANNGKCILIDTATANARVYVLNSHLSNCTNFGIHSIPTAGNVVLTVDNTQITNGGTTAIQLRQLTTAFIDNTTISGHAAGAAVALELGNVNAHISNSFFTNNNFGVFSGNGGAPTTRLFNTVITGSATAGISIVAGTVTSYGNNGIRGNNGSEAVSGAPTGLQ
jgi:hypothetical protein